MGPSDNLLKKIEDAVEEACTHVSFSKSTYWNAKRVEKAAKEGVWGQKEEDLPQEVIQRSQEQWDLLESGETTIGGTFDEVKEAKTIDDSLPETRGEVAPKDIASEKIDIEEPVRAAFPTSVYRFKQLLKRASPVQGRSRGSEADIRLEVYEKEVQIHTVTSKYGFDRDWLGGSINTNAEIVWIALNHADLSNWIDLLEDDIRVEMRGPKDGEVATHLVIADDESVIALPSPPEEASYEGRTILPEEPLENSPLSDDAS